MTQEAKQSALEDMPTPSTYYNHEIGKAIPKYMALLKWVIKYEETIRECLSQPATPEGWKTTVWQAWRLLNEIRARDGTAYQDTKYQMYRQEYRTHDDFNQLVEDMRAILGEDAQPWPPSAAAPVQEEM